MKVFRIELEKERIGPYCSGLVDLESHDELSRTPPPKDDPLLRKKANKMGFNFVNAYFASFKSMFGFSNMKQLNDWFTQDELEYLNNNGFVLSTYKVSKKHVDIGSYQLAFPKDKATRIEVEPAFGKFSL